MKFLGIVLLASVFVFGLDRSASLNVPVGKGMSRSPVGIWWPAVKGPSSKVFSEAPVVVWFHGGMKSSNCEKGLVAGRAISEIVPEAVVISVSACKENHWATPQMVEAVDVALDSLSRRMDRPVKEVSLVGVSDGFFGVMFYTLYGKRQDVKNRLMISSYGPFLGRASQVASAMKSKSGRWRFLQGGSDRLYPSSETLPWLQEFCRNIGADCDVKYDQSGEHDWSYWEKSYSQWIRQAIFTKNP